MQNIRDWGKVVHLRTGVQCWDIRWIHVPFLLTIRYRPDIKMWLISFTQQGRVPVHTAVPAYPQRNAWFR